MKHQRHTAQNKDNVMCYVLFIAGVVLTNYVLTFSSWYSRGI